MIRGRQIALLLLVAGLVGLIVLVALRRSTTPVSGGSDSPPASQPPIPTPTPDLTFDGARSLEYAARQIAFGPRPTGSEAHSQTGEYVLASLQSSGWQAETQPFVVAGTQARNLIGTHPDVPPGSPLIILGAHYDTRLVADEDATRPGEPVVGANDGASGVAVLLELANVLEMDRIAADVWLVFFDAEDNGRIGEWNWAEGSVYFADNVSVKPALVIVLDMIGDADQQIYYERNSDPEASEALWSVAASLGYRQQFVPEQRFAMLDDHTAFLQRNVRAVDIIDFDYPFWHTTQDTLDKLSAESLERVGRTLEVFLEERHWQAVVEED